MIRYRIRLALLVVGVVFGYGSAIHHFQHHGWERGWHHECHHGPDGDAAPPKPPTMQP
jgi:hypothetical protein